MQSPQNAKECHPSGLRGSPCRRQFWTMAKDDSSGHVKVIKTEEKGSDVNIAVQLVSDGFRNAYDAAVVVSNDSDLLPPIKFVKEELGKWVGVLNPQKHPSIVLANTVHFVKNIRTRVLRNSQFPTTLPDKNGVITKPAGW